jgi:hypothetical protein
MKSVLVREMQITGAYSSSVLTSLTNIINIIIIIIIIIGKSVLFDLWLSL